jgi:hypothetical protein
MDGAKATMTNFLLCVLIATVAFGFDFLNDVVQSDGKEYRRQAGGILMLVGLLMGGVLYGLLKLAGWIIGEYG